MAEGYQQRNGRNDGLRAELRGVCRSVGGGAMPASGCGGDTPACAAENQFAPKATGWLRAPALRAWRAQCPSKSSRGDRCRSSAGAGRRGASVGGAPRRSRCAGDAQSPGDVQDAAPHGAVCARDRATGRYVLAARSVRHQGQAFAFSLFNFCCVLRALFTSLGSQDG